MIILKDKPGQLCNRLWAFSPFISEALESDIKITILHFYDYHKYFEDLEPFKNIKFIKKKKSSIFYKVFIIILDMIPNKLFLSIGIINNPKSCITKIKSENKLVLIKAWSHQKPNKPLSLINIQKLFQPKKNYTERVDKIFLSKRKSFDLIIGVHIRRGDYKEYKNGIYYYSDTIILNYLFQLLKEFGKTKKLTFLLCSNEKIKTELYKDLPITVFQILNANLIEDLYGLSKCDYIVGPPSSYSMWASFYGQKPICFIKDSDTILKKEDFSIVTSHNRFENGHVLVTE